MTMRTTRLRVTSHRRTPGMRVGTRRTRLSRARRTRHSALDEYNMDHAPIDDVPSQMSSAPRPSQRQGRHGQRHGLTTAKSTQCGVHTRRARHYSRTHEQTQSRSYTEHKGPQVGWEMSEHIDVDTHKERTCTCTVLCIFECLRTLVLVYTTTSAQHSQRVIVRQRQ